VIVADTNLIAYLWIPGEHTATAEAVLQRDPDWRAPLLWRSELRSTLTLYLRKGLLDLSKARELAGRAEEQLGGREFTVPTARVLEKAADSAPGYALRSAHFLTCSLRVEGRRLEKLRELLKAERPDEPDDRT